LFLLNARRQVAGLLTAFLAFALVSAVPAHGSSAESMPPGPGAAPGMGQDGFRGRVAIHDGRKLFIACRGSGSPTVVLEAGTGDLGRIWSVAPSGPGRAVFPAVARFTRVCIYDRPGTYLLDPEQFSRSDPVAMPRTALDIAHDLRALLRAAHVPAPYVLAGHTFGGLVARLYATAFPRKVAGLVSIDAQNEDFAAAYKEFLSPEQYVAAVLEPAPPPGLDYPDFERLDLVASAAQVSQAQADSPLRRMPFVVLSHSRDSPNPFGFPAGWPIDSLDHAFQQSQDALSKLLPEARHVVAARSGHYIQLEQPRLVTRQIRRVVRNSR
jgi:pimeloyl-ACP methyl ester carboxylesterase